MGIYKRKIRSSKANRTSPAYWTHQKWWLREIIRMRDRTLLSPECRLTPCTLTGNLRKKTQGSAGRSLRSGGCMRRDWEIHSCTSKPSTRLLGTTEGNRRSGLILSNSASIKIECEDHRITVLTIGILLGHPVIGLKGGHRAPTWELRCTQIILMHPLRGHQ